MSVRVRFAPAPTGQVHIGNIRAAIFNWLYARHEGGKYLLRIEDTDRERSTPEAVQTLMDSLQWLGLEPDEPPLYQSTRTSAHLEAAELLLKKGAAYEEDKGATGQGKCVVFKMPGTAMAYHDLIKGDLRKEAADMSDFVIVRSNGSPVFHLANVVDDIHMNITHVIRGDDHVENTYRHLAMFQALGSPVPAYAHLPMIVNSQGKPYSKRDGAAFVGDFKSKGFRAEAFFNYLMLLGWSPGDDKEKIDRHEAAKLFTLERIKNGPAQMDMKKLSFLNGRYITELPPDVFVGVIRQFIGGYKWAGLMGEVYFVKVCALMQSRTVLFADAERWKYFFTDYYDLDEAAAEKHLKKNDPKKALSILCENLAKAEFNAAEIEKTIRASEAAAGMAEGKLNQPTRVAVTGLQIGVGLYETIEMLGKDRVLLRLDRTIAGLA